MTAVSSDINSACYSSLNDLKYGVEELQLHWNTILSIDPLLELSGIGKLKFLHCHYPSYREFADAPNEEDIQKLKERFPGCVIEVDWETVE